MNAPKKPGTDLSALKARLAKKSGDAPAPEAAPAPAAAAPAPKAAPPRPGAPKKAAPPPDFIPAPGEQAPAPAAAEDFIPAPGEVAPPPQLEIPAPGEVARPVQQAAAAAAPARRSFQQDDGAAPFSAGGSFDPNAGIIADAGGDIPQKGNRGLVIMAASASLLAGVLFGYLFNQITSKSALVASGKEKGAVMYAEAAKVAEMRKGIALKMADLSKQIPTNPEAAAKELVTLLTTNFEKSPKVDDLFGWQLAAVHPEGIKRTFDLYEEANGLKIDLGYLAGFVNGNAKALASGGPNRLAIQFKGKNAVMVERVEAMCGDPKAPTACGDKEGDAIGFTVRSDTNGQPAFAAIGTDDGQVMPLSTDGSVYGYIVGLNPENNAKIVLGSLLARVNERLAAMDKAEARALKSLKRYSDDPNVDGPAPADE